MNDHEDGDNYTFRYTARASRSIFSKLMPIDIH